MKKNGFGLGEKVTLLTRCEQIKMLLRGKSEMRPLRPKKRIGLKILKFEMF